jgi:hypothetical protein
MATVEDSNMSIVQREEQVEAVEGEIREFVRPDVAGLRRTRSRKSTA